MRETRATAYSHCPSIREVYNRANKDIKLLKYAALRQHLQATELLEARHNFDFAQITDS